MTRPTAINCTQCGAGLNVLGGGRVRAHVCGYCGAELDAQDNYRILKRFAMAKRPRTPFEIGMEGEIQGVPVTVIGTMAREEHHGRRSWNWVEHQVFSPTHGYAWLTWEDGYAVFTRKSRILPSPARLSEGTIETAEKRPSVTHAGHVYAYYASGEITTTYLEGEFNWIPELEARERYVSLLQGAQMLDILERGTEREYEISTLPDQAALLHGFGIDSGKWKPLGRVHPLAEFERSPLVAFLRNAALASAAACAVLALALSADGEVIARSSAEHGNPVELKFEVDQPDKLVEIQISANVYNSWAWFEGEVTDEDDAVIAEFEDGVGYYQGYEDGETWTEGSRTTNLRLHLSEGEHYVYADMTEAVVDWTGGRVASKFSVTVRQGVNATFWLWLGTLGFGVLGGAFLAERYLHHKRRMAGSDWSDD